LAAKGDSAALQALLVDEALMEEVSVAARRYADAVTTSVVQAARGDFETRIQKQIDRLAAKGDSSTSS
jgi:hypothetical protein